MPGTVVQKLERAADLRIGFVPLIDATPLLVAQEFGLFIAEGLRVTLDRQIGWGNVRDKLSYGQLHASHCLTGMPAASVLGMGYFPEPLVAAMDLGPGANAVTLSRRLTDQGVDSGATLLNYIRNHRRDSPLVLAHVFGCSTHHFLLRDWLFSAGINPDHDVRFCVLPPPQMVGQLGHEAIDGFCVGEPWNMLAADQKVGTIIAKIGGGPSPRPNKVIAANRRWLDRHLDEMAAVIRALIHACAFCADGANHDRIAAAIAKPCYLDIASDICRRCLRGMDFNRLACTGTQPTAATSEWIIREMIRWGHAPEGTDVDRVGQKCIDDRSYRRAAGALGLDLPGDTVPEGAVSLQSDPA